MWEVYTYTCIVYTTTVLYEYMYVLYLFRLYNVHILGIIELESCNTDIWKQTQTNEFHLLIIIIYVLEIHC